MRKSLVMVSLAITVLAAAAIAGGAPVTVNFDALDTSGGAISGAPLHNYLAGYGISVSDMTPGTDVYAADERQTYGGGVVGATSPYNYFCHHGGSGGTISYTLNFDTPLNSFGFSHCALNVSSIYVSWTATAYDSVGGVLDTASFPYSTRFDASTFTLDGPDIASVRFDQTSSGGAAFRGANVDDFVLDPVPEPSTFVLLGMGAVALAVYGRRRRRR